MTLLVLFPYSLGKSCQHGGGDVAERLMSALAYGWVERCSDIAGCGTIIFQDKFLVFKSMHLYLLK